MSIKNSFIKPHAWQRLMAFLLISAMTLGSQASILTTSVQASPEAAPLLQTNVMTLQVESATDGATISETVSRALIAFLSESDAHG